MVACVKMNGSKLQTMKLLDMNVEQRIQYYDEMFANVEQSDETDHLVTFHYIPLSDSDDDSVDNHPGIEQDIILISSDDESHTDIDIDDTDIDIHDTDIEIHDDNTLSGEGDLQVAIDVFLESEECCCRICIDKEIQMRMT